MIEIIRR